MRLYLINPCSPVVGISQPIRRGWHRVWKPLDLLVVAAMTPPEWEITLIDENAGVPNYAGMPKPDLIGITASTSQAPRAYGIAAVFRRMGVQVVMGGVHASMSPEEAAEHVDAVIKGEADSVWRSVLVDARRDALRGFYVGGPVDVAPATPAWNGAHCGLEGKFESPVLATG